MPQMTKSGFQRDTFDELLARALAAYSLSFGELTTDSLEARLAEIDAEMTHALFGYMETEAQGFMPMHAVGVRLKEWGGYLVGDMKVASVATGSFTMTGTNGASLPTDTRLVRGDGVEFVVSTGGVVAGGSVTVPIRSATSGLVGNSAATTSLNPVNPILNLSPSGTVDAPGLTGGAEAETEEAYRARILVRLREPSSGGNDTDYRTWALQVSGITRAWVRRGVPGSGEIVIMVMTDGATADGIPVGNGSPDYSGDLLRVYRHIEAVAPSPGVRYVKAPAVKAVDVVIQGLSPDTPETRAAVAAELSDMIRRKAEPAKTIRKSWISEAVATAAGVTGFDDIPTPAATVVCAVDEIAILGDVTYVT